MTNCLVAQSGGPTAVINASLAGVIRANQLNQVYGRVLGGLNGIEGVLQDRLYDLTDLTSHEQHLLRQTPGSALGSCRYKLPRNSDADYRALVDVMDRHDIDIMFYIGGNDSMNTVEALSSWAAERGVGKRFVGIPKTIDNDLMVTDHCPGFGSGAKFAIEVANATCIDLGVYTRDEVYILETMGRDAGWLAGSAALCGKVDLVVLPEVAFDQELFLAQVKSCMEAKGKCYIVVSEGAHYADGTYLAAGEAKNDGFGHPVLGGAGEAIKRMILDAGVSLRAKVQDLCSSARSSNFAQSLTDVTEAYELGMSAHARSADPSYTGEVVAIERRMVDGAYDARFISRPAIEFADHVKSIPAEWILPDYRGLTEEFHAYVEPLIQGEPALIRENGIPATVTPFYLR